jgi:hypothetical protein
MRDHPNARKLPRVIPVVVFHGASPWSAARSIAARIEPEPALGPEHADLVPRFTYLLDDLTARTPEELRDRALPAFAALCRQLPAGLLPRRAGGHGAEPRQREEAHRAAPRRERSLSHTAEQDPALRYRATGAPLRSPRSLR